ncbi:hypothetical protein [Streptomyces chryseus]|uniref:hypothetical protein n=1 Tax=Streptomyces chryseus TaxID=68186 RepID=UPI00110F76FE|nr:hypothetical protein [Streptomyces chryseus]GGX06009.1 hypothetical protein GCM10010353_21770 [Streptomyces chryseus]
MSATRIPALPGGGACDTPRTPVSPGAWGHDAPLPAPAAAAPGRAGAAAPPRRGPADPVRALMHRHRELCERAVDPLEIAAGLEAHGVTDRTAARFRHRDVFALAEELYARVPRAGGGAGTAPAHEAPAHAGWIGYALLPGVACALTAAGLELTEGRAWLAVGATGVLVVAVTLALCLRRGPLRAEGRTAPAARLWVCWLLGYAVLGDGLLTRLLAGGPGGPWPVRTTTLVALAVALAPAAWCAHRLAAQARRKLAASRGTEDFGASVRPLVLGLTGLFVCVLGALHLAVDAVAGAGATGGGSGGAVLAAGAALGTLLFLARLLTVHGFPRPASAGLAAAAALQIGAVCAVLAARLPGCGFLAGPVERLVAAGGAAAVPAVACAVAALALLVHATVALSRASAHADRARTSAAAPARRPEGRPGADDRHGPGPQGPDGRHGSDGRPRAGLRHGPH